ncbi:MAG: hypothetical protein ACLRM6_07320 [Christensenellales bacterium]
MLDNLMEYLQRNNEEEIRELLDDTGGFFCTYQKGTIENGCARYRSCQPEAYRQLTKEVLALEKQREEHRAEIGR